MKSVGCFREKRIPPPASLVPLVLSGPLCPAGISSPRGKSPLSGEAVCKLANAVFKKLDRLHKQHLKEPTLHVQARATTGVGKPQADSECNERIPPDGFDMAA